MVIRVVSGSNRIDVVLFHQHEFFAHFIFGHRLSGDWVMIVSVDAEDLDRSSVDVDTAVRYFDATKAGERGDNFDGFPVGVDEFGDHAIAGRCFRRPRLHGGISKRSNAENSQRDLARLSALVRVSIELRTCETRFPPSVSTQRFAVNDRRRALSPIEISQVPS